MKSAFTVSKKHSSFLPFIITILCLMILQSCAAEQTVKDNSVYSQDKQFVGDAAIGKKLNPAANRDLVKINRNLVKTNIALPPKIQIGSEKIDSFTTVPDWQYLIGELDVVLPDKGTCLVTCNLDVQSHVQTGYLTFRTARRNVTDGQDESDDGWAMDVPVPISQGSSSASWAWDMSGGKTYRFGCSILADRGFLGLPVYPNISWVCISAE